jgi:O-antigen/teichoic acid export membrane protein
VERAYRNVGYFLAALLPIFVAGFWIPYLSQVPRFDPAITLPIHLHAFLLFAWVVLLVAQPLAIRNGAMGLHRVLGRISYVLMPLIVVSAAAMILKEYHEHLAGGMRPGAALAGEFLSACQLALLAIFYCSAISHIRRYEVAAHMRRMICIALVLLPAGLARTFGYWFDVRQSLSQTYCLTVIDLCLIGLIWFDRNRRLAARPYVQALAAYIVVEAFWVALGRPV